MEIKNKEAAREYLKAKVQKNIEQFLFYFYGNIIINIIILAVIVLTVGMCVLSLMTLSTIPELLAYGIMSSIFLSGILSITFRNFLKNIRILNALRADHYDLYVKDYEWDHLFGFIEQLPMSKEEVERAKASLSFGKLIDILDLFRIINCENDIYDLDIAFRYKIEEADEKNIEV